GECLRRAGARAGGGDGGGVGRRRRTETPPRPPRALNESPSSDITASAVRTNRHKTVIELIRCTESEIQTDFYGLAGVRRGPVTYAVTAHASSFVMRLLNSGMSGSFLPFQIL